MMIANTKYKITEESLIDVTMMIANTKFKNRGSTSPASIHETITILHLTFK
jgi:hypothetical protein